MTIFIKEIKQSFKALCIWGGAIAFMIMICVLIFPQMKDEMNGVSDMFANMGGFSQAFGMDKVSFGEIMGFYAIECGNILGIGGGFFAAFIGISVLAKEEKDHTAEFLLTHPISRFSVLCQKLLSVFTQITVMNVIIVIVSILSFTAIGEDLAIKEFILLHIAFSILQIEIAFVCFGISAFLRRGSIGVGLGFAAMLYFMNIIANISEKADFLKYITPFAYAQASDIVADSKIDTVLLFIGIGAAILSLIIGFWRYIKKDIAL